MNKLIPVHHSVVDWDYQQGSTYRSLSGTTYISAPTSLRFLKPTAGIWHNAVLCRIPGTLCCPQGEVRNWVYYYYTGQGIALFRNQAPLGTSNFDNSYLLHLTGSLAHLARWIGTVYSLRDSVPCLSYQNQWHHYRVFWYNGKNPSEQEALCVDVYHETAGEWIKWCDTLYDTDNSWKDSATNRTGFRAESRSNHPQYWDDTEIWGPV